MVSESSLRQIDHLLGEPDVAARLLQWQLVRDRVQATLAFDPANQDAISYLSAAERAEAPGHSPALASSSPASPPAPSTPSSVPTSFVNGRYTVIHLQYEVTS